MFFIKNCAAVLAVSIAVSQFVAPVNAHSFWVDVNKEDGKIEVTFSENAGVPDKAIQYLKEKIESDEFRLSAFSIDKNIRGRLIVDWTLQEDSIVGQLPQGTGSSSVIVMG